MLRILLKELEGNFDSIWLVFIMVKLFMSLFRPPEIMYQMDHERHCAAIHLFNVRIARYLLFILQIHGEFVFITVGLFILLFPPQEITYSGAVLPKVLPSIFFGIWTARYEIYSIYITLLYGEHCKIHNSLGEPMRVSSVLRFRHEP